MNLQTVLKLEKPSFQIDYGMKTMMIGSCFVENIGAKLAYFKFQTVINPCGVVYNPISVAETLKFLLDRKPLNESELIQNNGKWVSLKHHGSFSSVSKEECLTGINRRLAGDADWLEQTDLLILTWGTAWVYRHLSTDQVVSNCHRFPASDFERYRLSVDEIVRMYVDLFHRLWEVRPSLKIILTVSPVRHWKDGAHGNQLSKAILLLAVERLCEQFKDICYFPAYELVMDELRDYRFYAEDMVHLSNQGIAYIWEKFQSCFIASSTQEWMQKIERCNKILAHRPFDENSESAMELYLRTQNELKEILDKLYTEL